MDGSSGGRGGRSGKGKSRRGKKQAVATGASRAQDKAVRSALQGGKKGGAAGQPAEVTGSPAASVSTSLSARQVDSGHTATIVPAESSPATTNKTKRQRPKKSVGQQQTMMTKKKKKKKKGEVTSEALEGPPSYARPPKRGTAAAAVPLVASHVVSLTGDKQNKKRKRNVSATCESTGRALATALKEGGELAVKNKLQSVSPPLVQKPASGLGVKHAATKGNTVEATSSTGTIAQVIKTSAKSQAQQALKCECTKTDSTMMKPRLIALPSATAKKVKAKLKVGAAQLPGVLTSTLDKSLVTVQKLKSEAEAQEAAKARTSKSTATRASRAHQQSLPHLQPKDKVQQVAVEANAAESTAAQASGAHQPLPQADATIAAKRECDMATTASRVEVATTEDPSANTETGLSSTTIDDNVVCPSSEPSTSTADVAVFSSPSPAALSTGTVRNEHISDEPMPNGATDTLLGTIETSRAVVVNDSSCRLTTTQLVLSPSERSQASVGYKRQLSHGRESATSVTPLQPSKRRAVASKLADDTAQAIGPDETQPFANEAAAVLDHASNRRGSEAAGTAVNIQKPHALAKTGDEDEPESSVKADTPTSRSAVGRHGATDSSNSCRPSAPSTQRLIYSMPLRPSERSLVQIQAMSSKELSPFADESERPLTTKEDVAVTTLSTDGQVGAKTAAAAVESNEKATDRSVVMDIPANVQGARSIESERSGIGNAYSAQAVKPTVSLAPRPRNAWGASFGLVPPARDVSSVSRTVSATPLSSWFLSNGCANFVKQVHFSDDDADGDSCSSGDEVSSTGGLVISNGVDKASFKRRASMTKKNAFLGSLLTQSHWRSWYGSVDPHNLLDPPLSHVPDKLRNHKITAFSALEETIGNNSSVSATKKGELESLEADIRREKQRGLRSVSSC